MTSPDFQIVEFKLLGISFVYEGSSGSVIVSDGDDIFSLKDRIDERLQDGLTQHIPAADQIRTALLSMGVPRSDIPAIRYADDQPTDSIPAGAIS
jgi:hypothetical protein